MSDFLDEEDDLLLKVLEDLDSNENEFSENIDGKELAAADAEIDENLLKSDPNLTHCVAPTKNIENIEKPAAKYLEILKNKFGHSEFRPAQWKIIKSILDEKRDNCVIMSTGYGKSLCFQYPAVCLNGITLVISPLISLMEDQVLALTIANISACLLGSAQTNRNIEQEIIAGEYRLVYASPEFICGDTGKTLLITIKQQLTLIAVDEAHCLSGWGHDFRPSYRQLNQLRKLVPSVPILAVTATATELVKNDICKCLLLNNPQIVCTGYDRSNLELIVKMKSGIWNSLKQYVNTTSNTGSTIIYCLSRKESVEVANQLLSNGIKCETYHAGMTIAKRNQVHKDFVRDKIRIIVATTAFGMGIDKPDVRMVIHYGAAKDIETYFQEIGRAGRDGAPAKCITFFSSADFVLHRVLRERSLRSAAFQKHQETLSREMQEYIHTRECRRFKILQYFEGKNAKRSETSRYDCCDNCRFGRDRVNDKDLYEGIDETGCYDFAKDAKLLLESIKVFNGFSGLAKPIALLRGSKAQSLPTKYHSHPIHGKGKYKSDEYWKTLSGQLESINFIGYKSMKTDNFKKSFVSQTVFITYEAEQWINKVGNGTSEVTLKLKPLSKMYSFLKKKRVEPIWDTASQSQPQPQQHLTNNGIAIGKKLLDTTVGPDLQHLLLAVRAKIALDNDTMPYTICPNNALTQLALKQPLNLNEMKLAKLDGFSDYKINQYGQEFINCILKFKNLLPTSIKQSSQSLPTMREMIQQNPMNDVKYSERQEHVYAVIKQNKSVSEMANELGLQITTFTTYTANAIKNGFDITKKDISRLFQISNQDFNTIKSNLPTTNLLECRLVPIKEKCPTHITYDMIKLVLAYFQVRYHLDSLGLQYYDSDKPINTDTAINTSSQQDKVQQNSSQSPQSSKFSYKIPSANAVMMNTNNNSNDSNKILPKSIFALSSFTIDNEDEDMFNLDGSDNKLLVKSANESNSLKPDQSSQSNSSIILIDDDDDDMFIENIDQLIADENKCINSSQEEQLQRNKCPSNDITMSPPPDNDVNSQNSIKAVRKIKTLKRVIYDSDSDSDTDKKASKDDCPSPVKSIKQSIDEHNSLRRDPSKPTRQLPVWLSKNTNSTISSSRKTGKKASLF